MFLRKIMSNKSVSDFLVMFISNIVKKLIGFIREIILASIFGSSILYANFILLRTVSDFFCQLTQGSALQASLLARFSKLYSTKFQCTYFRANPSFPTNFLVISLYLARLLESLLSFRIGENSKTL